MPIRFHRQFTLFPGVKVNVSKTGMSITVGGKGFHLNFSKRGVMQTTNLPGKGLSHRSYLFKNDRDDEDDKPEAEERSEEKREDKPKRKRRSEIGSLALGVFRLRPDCPFLHLLWWKCIGADSTKLGYGLPKHTDPVGTTSGTLSHTNRALA